MARKWKNGKGTTIVQLDNYTHKITICLGTNGSVMSEWANWVSSWVELGLVRMKCGWRKIIEDK
jgi:hypothetical protein